MNGIGLGLVISKMIVTQFEGTIDFISKYEEGSTFYFTFKLENCEDTIATVKRYNTNINFKQ